MMDFIFGELVSIYDDSIVILNNGIGYSLRIPQMDMDKISIGEDLKIFTRMIVREDDISLYGFINKDSRTLFDLLTTVSGIGPKVGIGMLSNLSNSDIRGAILTENKAILTQAPGIGKKTGDRIILELKDKISKLVFEDNIDIEDKVVVKKDDNLPAIEALITLGYNKYEAEEALKNVDETLDISKKIKEALKQLGR